MFTKVTLDRTDVVMQKNSRANYIVPVRILPFDIGKDIDKNQEMAIKAAMRENGYAEIVTPKLLKALSKKIIISYMISEDLKLYIYNYGIGVLVFKDRQFVIENENTFAVEYCQARKRQHASLLSEQNHEYSSVIKKVMEIIRKAVCTNKKLMRRSASSEWESGGISYVMTVSFVCMNEQPVSYAEMSENAKRNLQIMLEPSIVHEEDSLVVSLDMTDDTKPYKIDLSNFEEPRNWIKSNDFGVYISWAAVIIYTKELTISVQEFIECLEVDLQATWLYTYCLYDCIKEQKSKDKKGKTPISRLKNELYRFERRYNEFKTVDDTSAPGYVVNIRDELIRTSGIDEWAEKYKFYLEYYIGETESLNFEKQRKYGWISEIFLFVIAFVEIAPMLYNLLAGNYTYQEGSWWIIVILILIAVIGIIFIVRKD